jgi:hypothetical protein
VTAAQVGRELRIVVVAEPAEIDDPRDAVVACRVGKVHRGLAIVALEVARAGHQMHEVVGRRHARQRRVERRSFEHITADDLDRRGYQRAELGWIACQAPQH